MYRIYYKLKAHLGFWSTEKEIDCNTNEQEVYSHSLQF